MSKDERQVIWKFPFKLADEVVLSMPMHAKLLHVDQPARPGEGDLAVWALVWPHFEKVKRKLRVYGTGHTCAANERADQHVGTVVMGAFVWHVFDAGEELP